MNIWFINNSHYCSCNPLRYSRLENSMDRGACGAPVHGVTKSQTHLSDWTLLLWYNFSLINTNANLRQAKMDSKVVLQVPETIVNFIFKDYLHHECKCKILEPSGTPSATLLCLRSTGLMAFIVLGFQQTRTQGRDFLELTQCVLLAVVRPDPELVLLQCSLLHLVNHDA